MLDETFPETLKDAQVVENKIADFFKSEGWETSFSEKPDWKYYDIAIEKDGIKYLVEIKNQKRTEQSNKCVVERSCNNKPSGIITTKADIWLEVIHCYDHVVRYYYTTVKNLREKIEEKRYKTIRSGGNENARTSLYVFYYEDYKTFFKEFKI